MKTNQVLSVLLLFLSTGFPANADTSSMPLLPAGQYHTFETGFNIDNSWTLKKAIEKYQQQATEAGMKVKPLELDWSEIEPKEGKYNLEETIEKFETYSEKGWRPFVYLRAIDSDDITVPKYLKGTDDTISLSDIDVSSPRFIARYNKLMDIIVPLVRKHNGFAIMIANEPDNFLTPNPELTDQVITFLNAARNHIHVIDSKMAVGVALSNGFDHDDDANNIREPLPHHLALIKASDIAVYNFYCLKLPQEEQAGSIKARIQSRIAAAKGKDIVIQELGCPSGQKAGFSEEFQKRFFELAYNEMQDTSIRISIVFQLVDWTEATIKFYGDALRPVMDAEPAFKENPELIFLYLDQLGSIGLVSAKDGTPKPSWFEFLKAVKRNNNQTKKQIPTP